MKLGINISINVSKIDKKRLFNGKKGVYLDLVSFLDTENPDRYNNHGFVKQNITTEERNQGVDLPILGNVKIFYQSTSHPEVTQQQQPVNDIPF